MSTKMKTKHVIRIAMAFLAVGIIAACAGRGSKQAAPSEEPAVETCLTAIDRYLTEEIGSQYLPGEICIPFHPYTDIEETDGGDVLVWGDFWVMNYDVAGDTLKTVSGGAHPGMMRVVKTPEGHFEVTSFEQVGDGSDWEPTAKRIFGDRFSDFSKSNSDEKLREQVRLEAVAGYVRDHDLPVKVVKDYGWPAVTIPVTE
jgi:hypothetical protein